MKTTKRIGIWMDHSIAYVMPVTLGIVKTDSVLTKTIHTGNNHTLSESENLLHNKEQYQQSDYYKRLAEIIKNYEEVILFGPTDAKVELLNILKIDHHFDKIKIETKQSDRMTENQQHAFIKAHFSMH
ncbi:MAG: hypothetical protein HYZ42_07680 [Bacteroidetes bacterium]|nr:hypothetical protein [Bacteroidota bacterium]